MKRYLFKNLMLAIIVKAPTAFMACCYANQYMETKYLGRFDTSDAIELDNDMDFGVIAVLKDDDIELFNSENLYFIDSGHENDGEI
ncbi:MAG TPA: hypothetical protein PKC76_09315 [Saprospiraceae bacterium]|nr:hypothetical protein [Saprospiraceae bacterium]HMP24319.1 hypothetical protein [Saprospiraceae bacterium]